MKRYQQIIREYLKEHPFDGGQRDADGVIDFLIASYQEENPISGKEIDVIEKEIAPYYEELPFEGSSRLFILVYKLCAAYEKAALREGIMIGLHLKEEIGEMRG